MTGKTNKEYHQAGLHLFATIYDEFGLEQAKNYIKENNLTNKHVKIWVEGKVVSVVTIVEFNKDIEPITCA